MPRITTRVPEIVDSITRPVTFQVVRQMAEKVGLPKDLKIRYAGNTGALPIPGSTLDDKDAPNRLPSDKNITIDVSEEFDENYALSVAMNRPEQIVFFRDAELGVFLKPVYQRVVTTVNVKYTAADKTSAESWITSLKNMYSSGISENLHLVDYHYPIPLEMIVLLIVIHEHRENNKGYGEDFPTWFRNHADKKFTGLLDQAGNNGILVIRETQSRIIGYFDFNAQPPKAEKEGETGPWSTSFTYTFSYDLCRDVHMQYPLSVHNQMLPTKYYNTDKVYELEDFLAAPSYSTAMLDAYTYEERMAKNAVNYPGVPIPYFDDWLPRYSSSFTTNIYRILVGIDPSNPNDIIDLGTLSPIGLTTQAKAYIGEYPVGITQPGESLFRAALHCDDDMLDMNQLIVQQGLHIYNNRPMDERKVYHFTLDMLIDPSKLSLQAIMRLAKHGQFAIDYLKTVYPGIVEAGLLPTLLPNGAVSFTSLARAIESCPGASYRFSTNPFEGWRLVSNVVIVAREK